MLLGSRSCEDGGERPPRREGEHPGPAARLAALTGEEQACGQQWGPEKPVDELGSSAAKSPHCSDHAGLDKWTPVIGAQSLPKDQSSLQHKGKKFGSQVVI